VIFWVPGVPVFVDSRLESYPPEFLRSVVAAQDDDRELLALINRFDVDWVFANHALAAQRERALNLLRAGWQPVYVDSAYVILVRPTPDTAPYRSAHAIDLRRAQPGDLVAAPADLRKEQQDSFAAFLAALERDSRRSP